MIYQGQSAFQGGGQLVLDDFVLAGFPCARRVVTIEEIAGEHFRLTHKVTTAVVQNSEVDLIDDQSSDVRLTEALSERKAGDMANMPMQTKSNTDKSTAPALAETLWTVKDAAQFLRKSARWIFYSLQIPDTAPGSIPHSKLGRNPRFIPDDLRAWAAQGFPPVATFRAWKEADAKRARRNL